MTIRVILKLLNAASRILLLLIMVFVWALFAMAYTGRFFSPLDRLEPVLMPWKGLYSIEVESIGERLSFMQMLLEKSDGVANAAFLAVIVSFGLLSVFLTFVYQQKQRRSRENELLTLKNREIARRNEFIRYISATIGHEFKNNLGRIKRRLDLLRELPEDVRQRVDENFHRLFADIDIFKKISDEREASLIEFGLVNLREALSSLSAQYNDIADITIKNGINYPVISASETLLKTVFENIMDNAVKYKKPGQERAEVAVTLDVDMDDVRRYVSLSFRDRGIGMDELQAERCFYKGRGSKDGWGEGLYFAKYVVGLHAGKIRVGKEYTAPGAGTEIIMHLPYVEETLDV
jgi:signal transduction histidine kinase